MYKIFYQTPVGYFQWDDLGYKTKESALAIIEKEPKEYRKNMFIMFISRFGMERV